MTCDDDVCTPLPPVRKRKHIREGAKERDG